MSEFDHMLLWYWLGLLVFALNGLVFLGNRRDNNRTAGRIKQMLIKSRRQPGYVARSNRRR